MPEGFTLLLLAVLGLAVAFDYINGFHDTAMRSRRPCPPRLSWEVLSRIL